MKRKKVRKVWISGYSRKRNSVPGHYRSLNDANIIDQITNPKLTTIVELSPDAEKTLKALVYTLSGSLVISAIIRMRS